jgi:hypothetical protein
MPDLTYKQLQRDISNLAKSVAKGSEAIRARARAIDEEAKDTTRVAQMISGLRVDAATVAETTELARIMQGVSEAAIAYAAAGDTTAKQATAAHSQAQASHGGINEAISRSPVNNVHDINREWFRQE